MRKFRVAVRLLVLVLALLMLHSAAQGQTGRSAQVYQMAGTCSVEVRPDVAVIVGGVAAGALQPIEAVDKLEKQLALLRGYLDSNRGQLQLLERVRTLRTSPARRPLDAEPPFQVVQRLRAELPVNAPIDQILQRLIELGLDRFGDDVLNTGGSRREPVVRSFATWMRSSTTSSRAAPRPPGRPGA
ncbi:MAG TPA: SIMPL domain-containing protein [Methylomirabilota bacterium]|nr:SIMPL domain-containing protein [Methylomirabilota bacterium]